MQARALGELALRGTDRKPVDISFIVQSPVHPGTTKNAVVFAAATPHAHSSNIIRNG
jgi:hypothetical protein